MIDPLAAVYLAAAIGVIAANLGSALLVIWMLDRKAARYALARKRYHAGGAPGQARAGFPHITRYALPALRSGPDRTQARLHALLALMAQLDDTCLLHRGGPTGLAAVQAGARAVLRSGGLHTPEGRQRFTDLDRLCAARRLSPGGAGDLLAAALFLDTLDGRSTAACKL